MISGMRKKPWRQDAVLTHRRTKRRFCRAGGCRVGGHRTAHTGTGAITTCAGRCSALSGGSNKEDTVKRGVCIFLVSIVVLFSACENPNNNQIVKETVSPNGKYKAVCFIRDLGATTKASNQLSIFSKDDALGDVSGNVCVAYGDIKATWESDAMLNVAIENCEEIFEKKSQYGGIQIKYDINYKTDSQG